MNFQEIYRKTVSNYSLIEESQRHTLDFFPWFSDFLVSDAYLGPCQTSTTRLLGEHSERLLVAIIYARGYIIDVWQGTKYTFKWVFMKSLEEKQRNVKRSF